MNPLPVSLDLTSNSTSKPSTKVSASNDVDADKFKNELTKQEKKTTNSDASNKSVSDDNGQKNEAAIKNEVPVKKEAATVTAENGEQLPNQSEGISPEPEITLEQPLESAYFGELEIPAGQISIINPQEPTTPMSSMSMLGYEMISGEHVADYTAYGQAASLSGSLNPSVMTPGLADDALGINETGLLKQPLEKLMTLEQIKLSLEKAVDALPELDIDVDTDSEVNIREVFRFNDIQLKESQSGLKTYTTSVELPVAPGAWTDKVNDKIIWLANQKIQFAEIHLNPQDLGPMEVKINVQNEQATVTFTSHNQGVRELLELNVNRLREMMSENGVDLAHVDVSDQSSQQQPDDEQDGGVGGQAADGESELSGLDGSQGVTEDITLDNLVDYYA